MHIERGLQRTGTGRALIWCAVLPAVFSPVAQVYNVAVQTLFLAYLIDAESGCGIATHEERSVLHDDKQRGRGVTLVNRGGDVEMSSSVKSAGGSDGGGEGGAPLARA